MSPRLPLLLGCVALSSCAIDAEPEPEIEVAAKKLDDCPDWGCGTNSPVMDGLGFHDLHLGGEPNLSHFSILRMEKKIGTTLRTITPNVVNGELTATYLGSGVPIAGARFVLTNTITGKLYSLLVAQNYEIESWVPAGPAGSLQVAAYDLKWAEYGEPDIKHVFLCGPNPDKNNPSVPLVADFKAVVFENDWIDADTISVLGERAKWFNIGCAGSALAKQHLTGYTAAAKIRTGKATTIKERTANLKVFSGDYCGVGVAFTVAGQPLKWRDALRMYNTTTAATPIEARWNETGATCLNKPRVTYNPTPANLAVFPNGVDALISKVCTDAHKPVPPPCTGAVTDMQGAYMLTANTL